MVQATWDRVNDYNDPELARKRLHSHARGSRLVMTTTSATSFPLAQQLGYLRSAGFEGIDVYWKQLENVIFGGRRPAGGS